VADITSAPNFHLTDGPATTAPPALMNAIAELGVDRVMFSVDYPFEGHQRCGFRGSTTRP